MFTAMFADLTDYLRQIGSHPGQVFRDVLPVVLIATGVVLLLHFGLVLLTRPHSPVQRRRWNLWERLVYLLTLLCIADLGATAFYSVLRYGAMEGWFLLVHMVGAGGLVLMLLLMAVTWAEASRFGRNRAGTSRSDPLGEGNPGDPSYSRFPWLAKLTFWIILASGLVTVSTMLVSMLPVPDTDTMHQLLDIHRYSGLLLVVAALFHLYAVSLRRLGLR